MYGHAAAFGKILGPFRSMEGIFAINKPAGISSAQTLRELQSHFNPSQHFRPWLERERAQRQQDQQPRRKSKRVVQVKLGHGGTLDPGATGVLICGTGKGTKSLAKFLECTKTYEAVVMFGAATDSYDGLGKLVDRKPFEHITRSSVEKALGKFRGKFMQVPPIFSALHVDGKRLYEYAREGKEVPGGIEERPVEVESIELIEWMDGGTHDFAFPVDAPKEEKEIARKILESVDSTATQVQASSPGKKRKREAEGEPDDSSDRESKVARSSPAPSTEQALAESGEGGRAQSLPPEPTEPAEPAEPKEEQARPPAARIAVTSSRGFYVRSLCHDLGKAVGSLAFMAKLVRTRQGDFELGKNVFEYEDLAKGEETWAPQIERMLTEWNEKSK